MGHPAVENESGFAFEALFLADEEGRQLVVPVIKATYDIVPGKVELAEEQDPIDAVGEFWGKPGESPYKREPETAFVKLGTDVFLVGHARPPRARMKEMQVALRVGPLQKVVDVLGDRAWFKTAGSVRLTDPVPLEEMPLSYERAFGGWDRTAEDESKHRFELRNPMGTGFWAGGGKFPEQIKAPNIEDPADRITSIKDRPVPAGFGPLGCDWEPRRQYGGTYDEAWKESRFPLLPVDFDRRFFNAGSSGLVATGYLRGDEPVVVLNASEQETLRFDLPGLPPPRLVIQRTRGADARPQPELDTIVIDTDEMKLHVVWRCNLMVKDGPHEVKTIKVGGKDVRGEEPGAA
jgi:hypothetical protein